MVQFNDGEEKDKAVLIYVSLFLLRIYYYYYSFERERERSSMWMPVFAYPPSSLVFNKETLFPVKLPFQMVYLTLTPYVLHQSSP